MRSGPWCRRIFAVSLPCLARRSTGLTASSPGATNGSFEEAMRNQGFCAGVGLLSALFMDNPELANF
jgi:hypothetical protein